LRKAAAQNRRVLTANGGSAMFTELNEDGRMRLSILDLAGGQQVLSGVQAGRQLLGKLVAAARPPAEPEPAYLDFAGVSVATSSFLREGVIAFRDHARATLPGLYPVIANASPAVVEELDFFLRHRKDALWICRLTPAGEPRDPKILGELDEAHRLTFELVTRLGTASAPSLAAQSQESLAPTAWNNRLSNLAARGLLIERRSGKTKTFAPVLEAF
jgi:hypothetical protein